MAERLRIHPRTDDPPVCPVATNDGAHISNHSSQRMLVRVVAAMMSIGRPATMSEILHESKLDSIQIVRHHLRALATKNVVTCGDDKRWSFTHSLFYDRDALDTLYDLASAMVRVAWTRMDRRATAEMDDAESHVLAVVTLVIESFSFRKREERA